MMSSGGLTAADRFKGRDAILSGPAGGGVGMARTGQIAGHDKVIGFDMGGTSTDVAHFNGAFETQVAGVRMRAPMVQVHTMAAGGGPLTVTDANVMLGKLNPADFPAIFGPGQDQPPDRDTVAAKFSEIASEKSPEEVAEDFLRIAVESMANAVKKISGHRGHDVTGYLLNAFGGTGGQHACLVADALGMSRVLIHPLSGLLSAYGIGLARVSESRQQGLEGIFGDTAGITPALQRFEAEVRAALVVEAVEVEDEAPKGSSADAPLPRQKGAADIEARIPVFSGGTWHQAASNARGAADLRRMIGQFGLEVVQAYMGHVQDNAAAEVSRVLGRLEDGDYARPTDTGQVIRVKITIDREQGEATVDFTGTSAMQPNNFNDPEPVTRAAVLYVFRVMVEAPIPMNAGCLRPIRIIVPEGCMLAPQYPAAVVAGNVETSQHATNALFGALGALSNSEGTMNNLSFGNDTHQYHETICAGAPAGRLNVGRAFSGQAGVHVHMTNARLTDPEILESRYPVLREHFGIDEGSGGTGASTHGRCPRARDRGRKRSDTSSPIPLEAGPVVPQAGDNCR